MEFIECVLIINMLSAEADLGLLQHPKWSTLCNIQRLPAVSSSCESCVFLETKKINWRHKPRPMLFAGFSRIHQIDSM